MRTQLRERVTRIAQDIAASAGATAERDDRPADTAYPVTVNDPELTRACCRRCSGVAGGGPPRSARVLGAEDSPTTASTSRHSTFFVGVRAAGRERGRIRRQSLAAFQDTMIRPQARYAHTGQPDRRLYEHEPGEHEPG